MMDKIKMGAAVGERPLRQNQSATYKIIIEGRLDEGWANWFDGFTLTANEDGTTQLIGPVADQAALHGLLIRIRDLGITLVSVRREDK